MTVVTDSGAQSRISSLMDMIRQAAENAISDAGVAMLASAKERAPSMEEEYRELNASAGEEPLTPMGPTGSSDDEDGRVRFEKSAETYLVNGVDNLENMEVDTASVRVRVGNSIYLNAITRFKFTNLGASNTPYGPYEVGPYFSMFEGGTAGAAVNEGGITTFEVLPHGTRGDGGYYPLRPGAGPDGVRSSMTKSITGRFMFNPFQLQAAASGVLRGAMAEVGPSAE